MSARIRFVLVNPSHPGNIGAAARAMKVMGLTDLVLVNPECFPDPMATAMATNASDMLEKARVVESLPEALEGCTYVFATTARPRTLAWTGCDARGCAEFISTHAGEHQFAIVFGRERTGLTNEELDLAQTHVNIPTANDFHSLNLGQAVQVLAYECQMTARSASLPDIPQSDAPGDRFATMEELASYYKHLKEVLIDIDFIKAAQSDTLMRRLIRLYNRSQLSMTELNILRGILSDVMYVVNQKRKKMTKQRLYFDAMASTQIDPRVLEAMFSVMQDPSASANPSANTHSQGHYAAYLIVNATKQAAQALGCSANSLVWTSGASESIHLAVLGAARAYRRQGNHVISMSTEHKATLSVMDQLKEEGASVTLLSPDLSGRLDLKKLKQVIQKDTVLVSVLWVNNETGVIQDISAIADVCRQQGVLLHVDAAQAIGKVPVNISLLGADLVSLSAHKCYGPKGVGLLYYRQNPTVLLKPLISGGGQQLYRSGTLPTHQIVGAAKAIDLAQHDLDLDSSHAASCRDIIYSGLNELGDVVWHTDVQHAVPHCLSCHIKGVDISALLAFSFDLGLATGSACNAATKLPSHVLTAMGIDDHTAHHSLRISYGRFTTKENCQELVGRLSKMVKQLRAWSPTGFGDSFLELTDMPLNHPNYSQSVWELCCSLHHLGVIEESSLALKVFEDQTADRHVRLSLALTAAGRIASCHAQVLGSPTLMALTEHVCRQIEGMQNEVLQHDIASILELAQQELELKETDQHLLALLRRVLSEI